MVQRLTVVAILLVSAAAGCEGDAERARLSEQVARYQAENADLRRLLPSEQPKVAKDLDALREAHRKVREDLESTKLSLSQAEARVPHELLPLGQIIQDLRARLHKLEREASRKGHTHQYSDKGETFTTTKTTEGDK